MTTEFIGDKLNHVRALIQQAELELFSHDLSISVATTPTGDSDVDAQMSREVQNVKTQAFACRHRLGVYRSKEAELEAELKARGG